MLSNTAVQYAEPVLLDDIVVTDLGGIEDVGDGLTRYTFCVRDHGGLLVKVKLVTGPTLIWHTIRMTMQHFGRRCCGATAERVSH